jgi:hypothetical protein
MVAYESETWVCTHACESSRMKTIWYVCCQLTYNTYMSVLYIQTWSKRDVTSLELIDGDVDLLRMVNCDILTQSLGLTIFVSFQMSRVHVTAVIVHVENISK